MDRRAVSRPERQTVRRSSSLKPTEAPLGMGFRCRPTSHGGLFGTPTSLRWVESRPQVVVGTPRSFLLHPPEKKIRGQYIH